MLGRVFVSVQVAFVFCLVVTGAGFLVSLQKLFTVEVGFEPRHVTVLTMRSDLGPKQDGLTLSRQLQRRCPCCRTSTGLLSAGGPSSATAGAPNRSSSKVKRLPIGRRPFIESHQGISQRSRLHSWTGATSTSRDTDGAQPIPTIVNRAFARRYFGGEPVIGREFARRTDNARHVIIGVAADAYYADLRDGLQPIVYFPMKPPRFFTLYVRSSLDPGSVRRLVEQEARVAGPGIHVVDVTTLETLIGNSLLKEKMLAGVGGVFASLGLALVAIGLFGLLSYSVTRRTKELGVRAALGARRHALISLVLKELFGMMAGGLTVGLLASLGLMRLVHSQLFGIATVDPVVMAAAGAAFLLTTSIAVIVPAHRAGTMDPLVALRRD